MIQQIQKEIEQVKQKLDVAIMAHSYCFPFTGNHKSCPSIFFFQVFELANMMHFEVACCPTVFTDTRT